jgi:hypothetical protein
MLKKRIPTIVGLILLLIGVIGGVVFINQGTDFLPRAAPEHIPQKVKITNITDTGFVISWITKEPAMGFVKYSDNPLSLSRNAVDDRDQLAGSTGEYRTHYVSLQNLDPASTYYFKIGSQKDQLFDNNGQPFSITLPAKIDPKPAADTVFGTILTAVDTPAEGAIIYLSMENATPLSALVKQNGNWATNLSLARSPDLQSYATYDPETSQIDMLIQSNDGEPTTAVTTTGNDQPVPTIVLGKQNIFASDSDSSTNPSAPTTPNTPTSEINGQPGFEGPVGSSKFNLDTLLIEGGETLTITAIPADGVMESPQPKLSGQAPPGAVLTITVHSPVAYTGTVTADQNGTWEWLVPSPLTSGDHTVTVSYTDPQGKVYSTEKPFVIAATSLQQVDLAYAATPSATPVPTPVATPQPITTPIATPVAGPTAAPTPTPLPTPRTTIVATGSAEIIAGNSSTSIVLLLLGFVITVFGIRATSKRG